MAENLTLARPYAEAAFKVALAGKSLASWADALAAMTAVAADPQMASCVDHPRLLTKDLAQFFVEVLGDKLSAEQQKAFHALPQHDLEKLYAPESEGGSSAPLGSYDQKSDGTVDPKVAQGIATQLKALPREAVDRFLQKFGVQRIKDLPAAQVEKARAFVEQLQTELAAPAATETEVDPFA